jgi:hypothetical protein
VCKELGGEPGALELESLGTASVSIIVYTTAVSQLFRPTVPKVKPLEFACQNLTMDHRARTHVFFVSHHTDGQRVPEIHKHVASKFAKLQRC